MNLLLLLIYHRTYDIFQGGIGLKFVIFYEKKYLIPVVFNQWNILKQSKVYSGFKEYQLYASIVCLMSRYVFEYGQSKTCDWLICYVARSVFRCIVNDR